MKAKWMKTIAGEGADMRQGSGALDQAAGLLARAEYLRAAGGRRRALAPVLLVVALALAAPSGSAASASTSDGIILEWNAIATQTGATQPPFPGTRYMAAVQVAVFEAVNATTGRYTPYFGITAPAGASSQAAAITAAHGVLKWLFPGAAGNLDAQRANSLSAIPDSQSKSDGIAVGEAAAAAMISARTDDGSTPPEFFAPTSSAPYEWQRTPSCPPAGGAFFHWQNVKPFGVVSSSQFRSEPPPSLDSGRYARDLNEVQALGDKNNSANRPQDRADVARYYAAEPPHIGWNSVARQLAAASPAEVTATARTFALMTMSISDAHITTFNTKYFYRTWRPETAIARAGEDDNKKTSASAFTPFIVTPCFPGYPSAHGGGAGAGSRILEMVYGTDRHSITSTHPAVPGVTLHYNDLRDIVSDVSDARVYGGIHFRVDQDKGELLGEKVASYNWENYFQPVDDDDDDDDDDGDGDGDGDD